MRSSCILTYYHPSTLVVADDSELFARNVSLRFPTTYAIEPFANPRHALHRINENMTVASLLTRCFPPSTDERSLAIRMSEVHDEVGFLGRFRRVSVVLADYAMPAMNGLDMCRQIQDPTVRKVLITGVGDQGLAMQAFNDGSIDRYLIKSDRRLFTKLICYVRDLQREFFLAEEQALDASSTHISQKFTQDPAVTKYVEIMRGRLGVVEYYSVADPPGLFMLTANGEAYRLVVLDEHEMEAERHRTVPVGEPISLQRIEGTEVWFVGLTRDPGQSDLPLFWKSSYAVYLDSLDARIGGTYEVA